MFSKHFQFVGSVLVEPTDATKVLMYSNGEIIRDLYFFIL